MLYEIDQRKVTVRLGLSGVRYGLNVTYQPLTQGVKRCRVM